MIYFLPGINPEPWTAPNVAVGRRNGKPFPQVFKSAALTAYQEAIKEALADCHPIMEMGDLDVTFYLWRQLPAYDTEKQRKHRRHVADATNMQKALEDACNGILWKDDRDNICVATEVMEQGHDTTPFIMIEVEPHRFPSLRAEALRSSWEHAQSKTVARSRDDGHVTHGRGVDVEEIF